MNQAVKAAIAATLLASTLTLSHALMRAAANHPPFAMGWAIRLGSALALYSAIFFAYSYLLRRFELSSLYPTYTGLSMIGVCLVSWIYFNETITPQKLLGTTAIVIGVFLLAGE